MRLKIELLQAPIDFAICHSQSDCFVIQPVGFFVALCGVGLLHQIRSLLGIVFLVGFELLELLADRVQVLGFFVIAVVAMTTVTAFLAEQIFAFVDDLELSFIGGQHHVSRVTGLASCFDVLLRKERPQPVLVISVRLLNAGGGAPIALVARRATKFIWIVDFE